MASFPSPCCGPNPMSVFVFPTLRERFCKQRNTRLVPLAWSAPQDYCLPLASPLHFGSTQSLQTLQQSLSSASAKEISGGWRQWREKQQMHTKHVLLFPSIIGKEQVRWSWPAKDIYETSTALGWHCWIPDENNGREGQKNVLMSVVN